MPSPIPVDPETRGSENELQPVTGGGAVSGGAGSGFTLPPPPQSTAGSSPMFGSVGWLIQQAQNTQQQQNNVNRAFGPPAGAGSGGANPPGGSAGWSPTYESHSGYNPLQYADRATADHLGNMYGARVTQTRGGGSAIDPPPQNMLVHNDGFIQNAGLQADRLARYGPALAQQMLDAERAYSRSQGGEASEGSVTGQNPSQNPVGRVPTGVTPPSYRPPTQPTQQPWAPRFGMNQGFRVQGTPMGYTQWNPFRNLMLNNPQGGGAAVNMGGVSGLAALLGGFGGGGFGRPNPTTNGFSSFPSSFGGGAGSFKPNQQIPPQLLALMMSGLF